MIQCYRPFSNFTNYSHHVLHRKRNSQSYVVFSWHVFLVWSSLPFTTLTFLKDTGQWLCRTSFSLGLSNVSSWLDSGYAFFGGRILTEVIQFFSVHMSRRTWCWFFSLSDYVNVEHLIKEMSARFHYCKVIIFPFIINEDLAGRRHFSLNKAVLKWDMCF